MKLTAIGAAIVVTATFVLQKLHFEFSSIGALTFIGALFVGFCVFIISIWVQQRRIAKNIAENMVTKQFLKESLKRFREELQSPEA